VSVNIFLQGALAAATPTLLARSFGVGLGPAKTNPEGWLVVRQGARADK